MKDPLFTLKEAAEYARQSEHTMRWLHHQGRGPHFGRIGRRLYVKQSTLDTWIDQQLQSA